MSQSLLLDKTLGHLMEIVFHQKEPHKSKPDLKYYSYNFRKDQNESSYPVNDLKKIQIGNCYSVGSMLSPIVINKLKEEFNLIIAKNAPVFGSGSIPNSRSKSDEKLKKLPKLIDELIEINSEIGIVPIATQIKMMQYPSALNELVDFVEVDEQQLENLKRFLNEYVKEYSSKDLKGQGRIAKPSYYSDPLYEKLTSDDYVAKHGLKNTLLNEPDLDSQFCHSLLYLWHQNKISITSLAMRSITDGIWTEAGSGQSKYAYQWEAIVTVNLDNVSISYGSESSAFQGAIQANFLENALAKNKGESTQPNAADTSDKIITWGKISLNETTGVCTIGNVTKNLKTSKAPFKILKALVEARGQEVNYEKLFLFIEDHDSDREKVKTKIRTMRNTFGMNSFKRPKGNVFHATGEGYKISQPQQL